MIRPPFAITSAGYRRSPSNPLLFVHPDGHPYYPITIKDDQIYSDGQAHRLIIEAAYNAGLASRDEVATKR